MISMVRPSRILPQRRTVDALNYFTETTPDNLKRSQFGVAIGAPIMRDRWFVFGSYQGTRQVSHNTTVNYLPTQAERNGTFTGFLVDPATFFSPLPYNPVTNTTQIPQALLSPVNQNYLKHVPISSDPTGLYQAVIPNTSQENQYIAKTDYHWGNHSSFLRSFDTFSNNPAAGDPAKNVTALTIGNTGLWLNETIGDTWSGKNVVNDFRATYLFTDLKQSSVKGVPTYYSLGAKVTPDHGCYNSIPGDRGRSRCFGRSVFGAAALRY